MHSFFLILIFIFLPFRLHHLTDPLLDAFNFRQTQTATFALNMYRQGINMMRTELDIFGIGKERYLTLEFPIYEAMVTFLYRLFFFHDAWGRVVSIVAGFVGAYYLLHIVELITRRRELAILSAFFFLAAPLSMFYQRTVMIDPTIVTFLLAGMYYTVKWVQSGGKGNYLAAVSLLALGCIQKGLYGPFWLIPIGWYYISREGTRRARFREFVLLLSIPLFLLFLWQQHINWQNTTHGQLFFTTNDAGHLEWNFGTFADRLNWSVWEYRLRQLYNGMLLKPGIFVLFVGLFAIRSFDRRGFFLWFLVSQIIYFCVVFRIQNQNYYQIVMVPAFAVILAAGILKISMWVRIIANRNYAKSITISLFCAFILWRSWVSIQPAFFIDWGWYGRIQAIGSVTPVGSIGIFATPGNEWNSSYTYYSGRTLKRVGVEEVTNETLKQWKAEGYSFLVLHEREKYDPYLEKIKPGHSLNFVSGLDRLLENQEFAIYRL